MYWLELTWILRYTERFQVQDDTRSSSEEIPRPSEDEALDIMQSLTPAEDKDRRWSSTGFSRLSTPYQERSGHNLSDDDGLENRGVSLYEYDSSLKNSSLTTNPHILNSNEFSGISSLTSFPQAVPLTDSSSTAVYQTRSPTIATYGTDSTFIQPNRYSSSSFNFDEFLNYNNNNNNSDPFEVSPFPRPQSSNMLTGSQPATPFDQLFPSIDYGDALAYSAPSAVHYGREQRTEPLLPPSSARRQRGPLGMLNTHRHQSQKQERCTPSTTTTELHPRCIKRRVIQREARAQQNKAFSSV